MLMLRTPPMQMIGLISVELLEVPSNLAQSCIQITSPNEKIVEWLLS